MQRCRSLRSQLYICTAIKPAHTLTSCPHTLISRPHTSTALLQVGAVLHLHPEGPPAGNLQLQEVTEGKSQGGGGDKSGPVTGVSKFWVVCLHLGSSVIALCGRV